MLGDVNKFCVFKSLLTTPSNVLTLHLKQIFPAIIWIFTEGEGDGIESRLHFKIFSTLKFYRADSTYPHISWFLKILSLCLPIIQICHFQNIHLVKTWLPQLEKQMEKLSENAHDKYRLFLSAEPASKPENHIIPQVSFWKLQALKSKLYCKSIYPKLQNQDLST